MSKRNINDFTSLIITFIMLVHFAGLRYTLNLTYGIFKMLNTVLIQLYNTSILTIMFKYCIAFPIVGIILTAIRSPRGKEGHIIGKILYFIVGYLIGFILDLLSSAIF